MTLVNTRSPRHAHVALQWSGVHPPADDSLVCLFDGPEEELSALDTAIALAQQEAAHLRIVHVSRRVSMDDATLGEGPPLIGDWTEAVDAQAMETEASARRIAAERRAARAAAAAAHFGGDLRLRRLDARRHRDRAAHLPARLFGGDAFGWFVFWGYQSFIVVATTGYLMGVT